MSIEIANLRKLYGNFVAVDDISLHVEPGEVFGFLGPNGAGKTTTIRIMAGLSLPSAGTVRVAGYDMTTQSREAKLRTGYIPDRPYLYEKLSGWELLRFVADLYEQDWDACRERAAATLEYLELAEWADARIENYSHGMKQKLVIVSALVHDPAVLVIDEPMVGLDALAQKKVRQLLRSEANRGKTIFLTTHTLSVAEAVCDRIAILRRGRIISTGTSQEIKSAAGTPGSALEDVFLEMTSETAV